MKNLGLGVSIAAVAALSAAAATAREQVRVVGSSTVFPYSQAVAEEFGNLTGAPGPIVESTGTGGGMQIFCGGIGESHPDLTGASRAMTASEYALCVRNGVTDVSEAYFGSDGLSIVVSRDNAFDWSLTLEEIYLALGAQVPVEGDWVDNPYRRWSEINPELPDLPILVYGPPPTSGTRDAFVELALHVGCRGLDYVQAGGFDGEWVTQNCSRMRLDGPFIEAGENDNLIVQQLNANPNAFGIFGYSFLYENGDRLKGVAIGGVAPEFASIASGDYPISRPLFVYIKNAHRGVIPNLQEFVEEFMSENAMALGGYLAERGMVPLEDEQRASVQAAVIAAENMPAK